MTVENTDERTGTETVIAFVGDRYSSRVTPVRTLAGFGRLELGPGAVEEISIDLHAAAFEIVTPDGTRGIEAGAFTVSIADLETTIEIELTTGGP